jgi:hypothetical protein
MTCSLERQANVTTYEVEFAERNQLLKGRLLDYSEADGFVKKTI